MIARGTAANRAITSGRFLVPLPFCSQALSKQYLGRHLKTSSAGQSLDRGTMAGTDPTEIEKGDTVEWKWGGAKHISGEVVDKQEEGKAVIESKGKEITRNATPDNPAYTIHGASNPVLKKGSELEKVGEAEGAEDAEEEGDDDEPEAEDEDEEADEGLADDAAPATGGPSTRSKAKKAAS